MTPSSRRSEFNRRDAGVVLAVCLAGLSVWLLYVAAQPHDYALPQGSADRLDTLFGWRAPGISPSDLIERDRLWAAMSGWLVVAVVAGRLRPRVWALIGPATVLPALLLYFSTAPHDAEGWWVLNVAFLPVLAAVASAAAFIAGSADRLLQSPVAFGFVVGVTAAAALLMGGGESTPAILVVSAVGAVLGAALALTASWAGHLRT